MKKATVFTKQFGRLISAAVILTFLMILLPSPRVSAAPVITLTPTSGAVGTTITITGTVFDSYKGDNLLIYFDSIEIENSPIVVPEAGTFSVDFTVPASAAAGQHWIEVKSETPSSSMLARTSFIVDETTLTLDTTQGYAGITVNVNGSGFYVGRNVNISYMNLTLVQLGTVIASETGTFTYQIVIPASTAGFHQVIATNDLGNRAEVNFKMLPKLQLNTNAAGQGDTVTASGTGFASCCAVDIIFNSQTVASTPTDDFGSFETVFNVPAVQPQSYSVTAQDSQGNIDTSELTVTAGVSFNPSIGIAGGELTVNGSGFTPGQTVTIYYDDVSMTTASVDSNGDFAANFIVPPGGGQHIIKVTDGTTTKEYNYSLETTPPPMPVLVLPVNNSQHINDAYFDWSDVNDVSKPITYSLEIALDPNFSSVVFVKTGIYDSEYTLAQDEIIYAAFTSAPYYWRVRAFDGADNESEWATPWVFYIGTPSVPILTLPLNNVKVGTPIHFSWQASTSLSQPITYTLQIASSPDFTYLLLDKTGITAPEYTTVEEDYLNFEDDITYYWRVRAVDHASNFSDWSATSAFHYSPSSGFPLWATYMLISGGALLAILLAFRAGRRMAYR